jgi:hypothetical protein
MDGLRGNQWNLFSSGMDLVPADLQVAAVQEIPLIQVPPDRHHETGSRRLFEGGPMLEFSVVGIPTVAPKMYLKLGWHEEHHTQCAEAGEASIVVLTEARRIQKLDAVQPLRRGVQGGSQRI